MLTRYIDSYTDGVLCMSNSSQGDKRLNEFLELNLLGKIFLATLGAWFVGKVVNTKVRGTPEQIDALAKAMVASRRFQDELKKPGATVDSVAKKLNVKNMSASEFERVFNVKWPL